MKKTFRLSSLIAPAALLAATSAFALECPEPLQYDAKNVQCYLDMYGMESGDTTTVTIPTSVGRFMVYGAPANHTIILHSENVAWTFNVTGSATMKNGDKLVIKNGMNFEPFKGVISAYAASQGLPMAVVEQLFLNPQKIQGTMFECDGVEGGANCDVTKQTGFNALVIESKATQRGSRIDLMVQHEIFDFRTTTVFNVKGVDRSFAALLFSAAGLSFDISSVPEDATTLALVDADFTREDLAKKAKFVNLTRDIPVDLVYFNRAFTPEVLATMTLPFDLNTEFAVGLKRALKFNGIKQKEVDGKLTPYVSMKRVWEKGVSKTDKTLEAYKPYLVEMEGKALTIASGVTLQKTDVNMKNAFSSENSIWDEHDGWVFYGTLAGCQWTKNEEYMPKHVEGEDTDNEEYINDFRNFYAKVYGTLGRAYGFAAQASDDIVPGQFVRAGEEAYIGPYRAFLMKKEVPSTVKGTAGAKSFSIETPDVMDVVIEEDDDQPTTVIGQFNTRTGEFTKTNTRVFDLKGRSVKNNAPRARGAYYGKKSVVR